MNDVGTEIKRWTAKRKVQVVLDILKGKTTVTEVSRQHDLTPAEVENWVEEGVGNMENGFRSKPRDVREMYERKLDQAHAALGESQLEIKALKKYHRLLELDESS
ncbi:MAG: transposase [Pseudomonadota bacterium]